MPVPPVGFSELVFLFTVPAPAGSKVATFTLGSAELASQEAAEQAHLVYNETVWIDLGYDQCSFDSVISRDGANAFIYTDSLAGTVDSPMAPPNVSLLVRKVTSAVGRQNRGRMYPPGLVGSETYEDNGRMISSQLNAYNAAFGLFYDGMNTRATPVILHQLGEGAPTEIDSFSVDAVASTQRRRLR